MKDVEIGLITSPCGIRGEVKVKSFAEDPSRFRKIREIALCFGGNRTEDHVIEKTRMSGGMVVLKFAGVDDRNAAEKLRGAQVFMDSDDLEELPEGQHYIRDLIGLDVLVEDTGEKIGKVADVLTDRPQDIYVIKREDGSEFMIPSVPEFIREISESGGYVKVRLIEGME